MMEKTLYNLEEVLCLLRTRGIRVKRSKYYFMKDMVEYLGHMIDTEGLHTSQSKVRVVLDAPPHSNLKELRSFLGMMKISFKLSITVESFKFSFKTKGLGCLL